ncbi:hypothetical protein CHLNCDRAFT_22496 [Chlorella variabilis]|uniref:Homoserine kinase n=1 Tax=Chlorella variabilis TaxID=554065 RepID=E1ZCK0_CHLVA|nr:hypothetical protein CHLNCDRAFT_22496 [Chlorella variabilis]EFN56255.1 hypothetical protein CHLNCDRAFT_22496 [Chlorella variabilis]|eukprot:XP_005848357.1 hypothetical protein CHLNCDRAFT_22496 [Chlorella variabilis]
MQRPAGARLQGRCCPRRGTRVQQVTRAQQVAGQGKVYIDPVEQEAAAFAPATVANLGPGFDWMGCAVEGDGDVVTARVLPDRPGEVVIESIEGDGGRLSLEAPKNCIGIAAIETLRLLGGAPSCGVALTLRKGLPLGSGMGSSAASAAASAWAVNTLFGCPLSKDTLIIAGLASEAVVSGYHADNIAPALMGGFILIRSCDPLDLQRLPFAGDLWFVLVNPRFEAPTSEMRAVLPKEIPMKQVVNNCAMGGSLVAGILGGDAALIGRALDSDAIVEPVRGPLIPGFQAVKEAARAAGAFGCTISGAGPTAVAIVSDPEVGQRVKEAMVGAFKAAGGLEVNSAKVVRLDNEGAKRV